MVDLNDVRVFLKVVESRSFSAAARGLAMPRATVSRRVAKLEKTLGIRLLQRTTRSVSLTDVGASYHERCVQGLATLDEAEAMVNQAQASPRGLLRLTGPHDLGRALAPIVTEFSQTYPEVVVELEMTQRLVDLVAERFDIAIRATGQLVDSSLVARRVADSRLGLFASQAYLDQHGTPAHPRDLKTHRCIMLRKRSANPTWRFAKGSDNVEVPISPCIWVNDPTFGRACAQEDGGIAVIPTGVGPLEGLVEVLPKWKLPNQGGLFIVYPSKKHLSATVRAFCDFAIASFRKNPLW